jgi:hypothetical protein
MYAFPMKLEINPRGNGACPICARNGACKLQKLLAASIEKEGDGSELEVVIYTCAKFSEKD